MSAFLDDLVMALREAMARDPALQPFLTAHAILSISDRVDKLTRLIGRPRRAGRHNGRPPYPGLAPFTSDDRAFFFGREADLFDIRIRLEAEPGVVDTRRIVLTGDSGVGKSSFVKAGLIPALLSHGRWTVFHTDVPSSSPRQALADLAGLPSAAQALLHMRKADWQGRRARTRSAVVVDQAERLLTCDRAEAGQLVRALNRLASSRNGTTWVLFVVRSEFASALLGLVGMSETKALTVLEPSQIALAIEKPAELVGASLEPGLAARILADAGSGRSLPLLATVLRELWDIAVHDSPTSPTMTLAAYETLGGVRGAIAHKLDVAAGRLGEAAVFNLLLSLVAVEPGLPATARPRAIADLDADTARIARRLADARLLTVGTGPRGDAVLNLSHDSIIDAWPRFSAEIERRRVDLEYRDELGRRALSWDSWGRADEDCLVGLHLDQAVRWARAHPSYVDRRIRIFSNGRAP